MKRIEKLIILLVAFIVITACSKNSFLYPMNDWDDISIYIMLGREVLDGTLLYKDLFSHNGIIIPFIYGTLSYIGDNPYMGIYLVEILSAYFYLYFGYKTIKIIKDDATIIYVPLLSMIYASKVIRGGGCLEELFLPCLVYTLYIYIRAIDKKQRPKVYESITLGVLIGIMMFTKYTLLFAVLAIYLSYGINCYKDKNIKNYLKFALYNILGCLTVVIPIIIYLYNKGIFNDMIQSYIRTNVGEYNLKLYNIPLYTAYSISCAPIFMYIVFMCIVFILKRRKNIDKYVIVITMLIGTFITNSYGYYLIPLSTLIILGLPYISDKINIKNKSIITAVTAMILVGIYFLTPNAYLRQYNKSELPHYKILKLVDNKDELLSFTHLDNHMYVTNNKRSGLKYTAVFNTHIEEGMLYLLDIAKTKEYEYVFTDSMTDELMELIPEYELIAEEIFIRESVNNFEETYRLYKLNSN